MWWGVRSKGSRQHGRLQSPLQNQTHPTMAEIRSHPSHPHPAHPHPPHPPVPESCGLGAMLGPLLAALLGLCWAQQVLRLGPRLGPCLGPRLGQ